jgi:hypothetical protein
MFTLILNAEYTVVILTILSQNNYSLTTLGLRKLIKTVGRVLACWNVIALDVLVFLRVYLSSNR